MFNERELWKDRFLLRIKEIMKYVPYILNGHMMIVLLFLIGTVAFYYQQWVKTLSPHFPVAEIMSVSLAFLLTYSPIYTFLLSADRIFLLPLETKLSSYFKKSLFVSFFIQIYGLLFGLLIFMPMYAQVNDGNYKTFLPFLLVLCGAKLLNVLIRWRVQYYVDGSIHRTDGIVRFFINVVFLYLLFSNANIIFLIVVALLYLLLFGYYYTQTKERGIKWELLIELENRRMMSFYRFANMFTDVPKLTGKVKRRKWHEWLYSFIPFKQENTYMYLYISTFFRGGDYFGLFLRLTIIGMIAIYFLAYGYGQIALVLLFLFLTGFQLFPLWNHHQNKIWIDLYPIMGERRKKSFQTLLFFVLMFQTIFLSAPILLKGDWLDALFSIVLGIVFSYLFVYLYIKKQVEQMKPHE